MSDKPIPPHIAEQTTKNLALARKFLAETLDDPKLLNDIPEGTRLVLIDPTDNDLSRRNFELAVRHMFQGDAVKLQLVGLPTPEMEAWKATVVRGIHMHELRFPTASMQADALRMVYDQAKDTLFVDYFNGQRKGGNLQIAPHVILRIDEETHEILGYLVASYLETEAWRSPVLARALRKAALRPLTAEELGDVEINGTTSPDFDPDEAAAIAVNFARLIA